MDCKLRVWGRGLGRWVALASLVLWLWAAVPPVAQASLHTYRERPGQVTVRSRQSLRDDRDRAWQAIAFKRTQGTTPPSFYLRLVGFPEAVTVDRHQAITLLAPTGQQWQLPWAIDAQTPALPTNVGQYALAPLLADITQPLPLTVQVPLLEAAPTALAIAPFVVAEWLQVKAAPDLPAPVTPTPGK